ncbi:porin [Flavobacterium ginsengisoli]|uniref:Porin n=1 Tax=Flavobacterium ginsengisoli TaxID=871694 RepID=A0ABP7G116_9FLAO|nr:porin [Flavobacterium sp. UBA4854]
MRILFLILSFSLLVSNVYSQQEKQADTTVNHTVPLIKANKADLLNNIDVIFNTQIGLNNNFEGGNYTGSSFEINQFRFEVKGKVYKDKVFFRFRDRYTRDPETQSVDNISHSTDLAFIGYKISDRTSIAIGKMTANWGGYEFDMNPIDIYQYNDIVDNSDNFLTGVQFNWTLSKNHVLSGQILNSRTKSFTELYENVPDVEEAKFPAAYIGNWNGSFLDGKFKTIYSFSVFQEALKNGRPVNMYYTALGNQFRTKKWLFQYDFKWSIEDLDRTGVVSSLIPETVLDHAAENVYYIEHWLRTVYSINEQWKISLIGMISTSYWKDISSLEKSDRVRTAWGVIPTVEFYPIKNFNLKFFATYVGRYYRYSDYSKTVLGQENNNTGRIMIGVISPLLVL